MSKKVRVKIGEKYTIAEVTKTDINGDPVEVKTPDGKFFNLLEKSVKIVSFLQFILASILSYFKK